jgi:hypothetical protein
LIIKTPFLMLRGGFCLPGEFEMDKEAEKKMLEYIVALEGANKQLVTSLKLCVELLSSLQPEVPDQQKWQNMLKEFETIIAVGEKLVDKKTFH